ncbi:MAG TPA: hypothetical protein VE960_06335, partial [bacterium]|nr:hypothetical protein [bacterium]
MRTTLLAALAVGAALILCIGTVSAKTPDVYLPTEGSAMERHDPSPGMQTEGSRLETLWIFDADFSTTTGDNDWTSTDRSGTLGSENYWHHDTIRIGERAYLGDSTWWCGTYNSCWRQDRGYGNDWTQILERHFTETTSAATAVILEFDQRYAMEKDYDYGYVDVRSSATSDTFFTVMTATNTGFAGTPGLSHDWESTNPAAPGHAMIDISPYAMGVEFDLRFRFESDGAYSSEDQWNSPPQNACLDGAWQLDNIEVYVDGGATPVFADDAEGGDPWTHPDIVASGQTGVQFWRGRFGIDFVTGREFTCDNRPIGTWMWCAVDPFSGTMIDDQWTWLMSPPIDI